MKTRRTAILFTALSLLTAALFIADLAVGSVAVPPGDVWAALTGGACDPATSDIILKIRLLKAVTALFAGAALAASGLEMQTLFRNPLAGPYVLGVSSGAGLGVALFLLGAPLLGVAGHSFIQSLGVAGAAWLGSALVLAVVMAVSRRIKDIMVILILGMMFGSGISSVVEILQYLSSEAALKSFVIWTMGSLGDVTGSQLALLLPVVTAGLVLAVAVIKPLNLLLLGENYARTMGLNVQRTRTLIFLSTVLLAGTVTAFCGPVGFIGLAVPHLARMLFASADHRILMPGSMLAGAALLRQEPRPADQHHHGPDGHSGRHLRRRPQPQYFLSMSITLRHITLSYGSRTLLENVTASFEQGSLTALIGRNGTGKSTLLRAVAGLGETAAGEVELCGRPLAALTPLQRATTVGFVTTDKVRIANLACEDVVALGRAPYTNWIGRMQETDRAVVERSLRLVGMSGFARKTMDRMSDGECQRVMIARVLAQDTPVILLDEPTAFLDLPNRYSLAMLLRQLAHDEQKCILFSTHDLDVALSLCDSVALIDTPALHHLPADEMARSGLIERLFSESNVTFDAATRHIRISHD